MNVKGSKQKKKIKEKDQPQQFHHSKLLSEEGFARCPKYVSIKER